IPIAAFKAKQERQQRQKENREKCQRADPSCQDDRCGNRSSSQCKNDWRRLNEFVFQFMSQRGRMSRYHGPIFQDLLKDLLNDLHRRPSRDGGWACAKFRSIARSIASVSQFTAAGKK